MYDKYFSGARPLNKIIYKILFTSEILPYKKHIDKNGDSSPTTPMGLLNSGKSPNSVPVSDSQASTRAGVTTSETSAKERVPSANGLRNAGTKQVRSSQSSNRLAGQNNGSNNRNEV